MKAKFIILFVIQLAISNISMAQNMPDLGPNASYFTIFTAAGALTNVGKSEVYGNVGTNAGAFAGFTPDFTPGGVLKNGTSHIADSIAAKAIVELLAAYTNFNVNTTCHKTLSMTLAGSMTLSPDYLLYSRSHFHRWGHYSRCREQSRCRISF